MLYVSEMFSNHMEGKVETKLYGESRFILYFLGGLDGEWVGRRS